jgi:hypothetical protein
VLMVGFGVGVGVRFDNETGRCDCLDRGVFDYDVRGAERGEVVCGTCYASTAYWHGGDEGVD